jgi:cytochrome c-type biogenesis protein CcmE
MAQKKKHQRWTIIIVIFVAVIAMKALRLQSLISTAEILLTEDKEDKRKERQNNV